MNYHEYKSCVDACQKCSAVCYHCARMDLKEKDVTMMSRCAQLNMECAAICTAAANLMMLGSDYAKDICKVCARLCRECGEECAKHDTEHCRECAESCTACAEECEKIQIKAPESSS